MNYITSCPNCETQFLLNDDLIKAYRGKVQCGHCEHVFNAKNRLTEVSDDITTTDEYQASLEEAAVAQSEQETNSENAVSDEIHETEAEAKPDNRLDSPADVDFYINPLTEEETPAKPAESQAPSIEIDSIFNKKSKNDKATDKNSSLVYFAIFLLLLTLILQCAYYLRNDIARQFPATKPLLERACVPLKCTIDLAKNLDLITIGDSDMQEDDTYQSVIKFSSALKNNASYPQAYPNIELTLTDANDHTVIKKLITPAEFLASKAKIKHGLDANETASIKLAFHVDDPTVASYRILLLY